MVQEEKEGKSLREDSAPVQDVRTWQEQLVQGIFRALVVVGFLAVVVSSYYAYSQGQAELILVYCAAYAIVLVIAFWRRVPYAVQVWTIIGAFYVLALVDFATEGRGASARLFLLLIPFVAALLLGRREAILSVVLVFLTMAGFGWAFSTGLIVEYQEVNSTDPSGWASNTGVVLMLGTLIVVSLNYLVPRFAGALRQSRLLTEELERERGRLEQLVSERTRDLARRGAQLETAAQIARDAAVIQDVGQLLEETVQLVSTRFGFYHTGLFLLDAAKAYAVLRAASSPGGQRMLARGHRLKVGGESIVGYVTMRGQPRVVLDVGADAVFFDNPDLPETHSEVALPLRVRGEIIGALDVQSTEVGAFDEDDVIVIQTLADQVAVAISNAQLFQRVQESLEAERRAYGELSREAWQGLLRARPDLGQRYDPQGILPAPDRWREEARQAAREGQAVPGEYASAPALAVPLKVREQVIGVLDAHKLAGAGDWTAAEIALLQTLVDQLGLALESARLYQDSQHRAARERLIGEISTRMRETLDVDTVLRTAIREMGETLSVSRVEVRMGSGASRPERGKRS